MRSGWQGLLRENRALLWWLRFRRLLECNFSRGIKVVGRCSLGILQDRILCLQEAGQEGLEAAQHRTNSTYVLAWVLEGNWAESEPLHQEGVWLVEDHKVEFVVEGVIAVSAVEVTALGNTAPPASIARKPGEPK